MNYPRPFDRELVLESYGVTVKIQSSDADLLAEAEKTARTALVGSVKIIESMDAKQVFGVSSDDTGTLYLFMNGERIATDTLKKRFFKFFNGLLRLAVAEHAPNRVFVHAGVVGWKGKAIIIPAKSFGGKTTLVAEFVRKGAEYYSDEYAVFDEKGLVHPFPRDLSVRDNSFKERDIPVAEFGGIAGTEPIPVGAVIITEFEEKGEWLPRKLTVGQGIMELIPHTIPRNVNTKFALKVLNTAVSDAIILKSHRGEANDIALNLLSIY